MGRNVNKRLLLDIGKYVLAVGLLVWVIRANWAPTPTRDIAALGASTVGLCTTPGGMGPMLAAATATPGRTDSRGLGYVWDRHVVRGQPVAVGFLATALVVYVSSVLVTLMRWYLLVRALDLPLRLRDAFRYGFIGIFFNTFLPGAVGGDIIKAAALARTQNRRTAAVASVIMDRAIALGALVWFVALTGGAFWALGMLSGPAAPVAGFIVCVAAGIVVVSLGVWAALGFLPDARAEKFAGRLSRLPVVGNAAAEFWRSIWVYRKRGKAVAQVMALSWVGHVGFVVSFYCCARALWEAPLGPIPSLSEHFLLVPIGLVMQALIPTPGGAGAGEWSFAALYVLFHAGEANGVLGSLVQRLLSWLLGLVGFGVYAWLSPAPAKKDAPRSLPAMPTVAVSQSTAMAG